MNNSKLENTYYLKELITGEETFCKAVHKEVEHILSSNIEDIKTSCQDNPYTHIIYTIVSDYYGWKASSKLLELLNIIDVDEEDAVEYLCDSNIESTLNIDLDNVLEGYLDYRSHETLCKDLEENNIQFQVYYGFIEGGGFCLVLYAYNESL